jgi:hypothetical protein
MAVVHSAAEVDEAPSRSEDAAAAEFSDFDAPAMFVEVDRDVDSQELSALLDSPSIGYRDVVKLHIEKLQPNSRQWMKDMVHNFATSSDAGKKIFWLQAEAGMGKTAFSAWVINDYQRRQRILAANLFRFGDTANSDVRSICKSIAFQISLNVPPAKVHVRRGIELIRGKETVTVQDLIDKLIIDPLNSCGTPYFLGSDSMLMVFDALDEIGVPNSPARSQFLRFLKNSVNKLPDWVKVFITSRPEEDIIGELKAFEPVVIFAEDERHLTDLREFIRFMVLRVLRDKTELSAAVDLISKKSEGRFIYVSSMSESLLQGHRRSWNLDSLERMLPDGLDDTYMSNFERIRKANEVKFDKECRSLLSLLVTMQEPMRVIDVHCILRMKSVGRTKQLLRQLCAMFPIRGEGEEERIYVYHKSVVDFLIDEYRSDEL